MHLKHPLLINSIKYAALSIVLSQSVVFGLPAQYIAPLCLVCTPQNALIVLATSLLCIPLGSLSALRIYDIVATIALLIIRAILKKRGTQSQIFGIVIAILSVLLPVVFSDADTVMLALNRVVGAFVTGLAYAYPMLTVIPTHRRIICLTLLLSSLSGVSLLGINPAIIASVIIALHIATFNDPLKTVLFNISIFTALTLPQLNVKIPLFVLITSTLISRLKPTTRVRLPLYFVCLAVLFGMLNADNPDCIKFVFECFLASVIYLLTFEPLQKLLTPKIMSMLPDEHLTLPPDIKSPISCKTAVTPIFPSKSRIVRTGVCSNCRKYRECTLVKANDFTQLNLDCSATRLESHFADCINKDLILRMLAQTDKRTAYISDRAKMANSSAEMLNALLDINSEKTGDKPLDMCLSHEFERRLLQLHRTAHAWVYEDLSCVFTLANPTDSDKQNALDILQLLTSTRYHITKDVKLNGFTYVYACPKPEYDAVCYCESVSRSESTQSGDVFDSLTIQNHAYFVLCDGMGTGTEAFESAKLLLDHFKNSLDNGLSVLSSLKLSETLLRLTSLDESFAAVDILDVDLTCGNAVLYKAGGADSFVLGENFFAIPQDGFPVGVLGEISVCQTNIDLSDGGEVVMASDGAELNTKMLQSSLAVCDSSEALCHALIGQKGGNLSHNDDACVAVVSVYPRNR